MAKPKPTSVSLPDDLRADLAFCAEVDDLSLSEAIRRAIEAWCWSRHHDQNFRLRVVEKTKGGR